MSIFDNIRDGVRNWLGFDGITDERAKRIERNRAYAAGRQKHTLIVSPGKTDDNVIINIIGLIVDRWVSWLFGKDIEFDLPGDDTSKEQEYIDSVWDANHKSILLHKVGVNGSIAGTAFVKIVQNGVDLPKLVAVDPAFVSMDTSPEDIDEVIRYTISYSIGDKSVKEVSEIVDGKWTVKKITREGNKSETTEDVDWEWTDFSPVVHCQNLPSVSSAYGVPDITEPIIELQNAINLNASNIQKANRLHAAPQLWGNKLGSIKEIVSGTDKIIDVGDGTLQSIQMQEMVGSSNFLQWLVKELMATTRTVDLDSIADKLGNLTNFGLRVMYEDTLTKLETKRALYGEMLCELNRRLLIMGGFADPDPGTIHWKDVIPQNLVEIAAYHQTLINGGLESKETAAMGLGINWAKEQEKIANDKTSEGNIGASILNAFNRDKTPGIMPNQ